MPRLGVRLETGLQLTPQNMQELASMAEERGYEVVWVPEGGATDALTQLTAFATTTHRIKLGTGILPIFSRTPTLVAMSAGGLDAISQGRFILGLGVGHQESVENGHGIRFGRPLTRMRETVEIVRGLLRGERVTHMGREFNLLGSGLGFTPFRPDVPIYLAALGPRMIELAGQIADGVLLNWASPSYLQRTIEHLHQSARRAGRNPEDIDVACYLRTAVVDDLEQARPALQRQIARYCSMPFYRAHLEQSGFGQEIAEVSQAIAGGDADAAAASISEAMLNETSILGTAEHCRQEVEARRRLGLKLPVISPFPVSGEVMGSFKATIEAFSG